MSNNTNARQIFDHNLPKLAFLFRLVQDEGVQAHILEGIGCNQQGNGMLANAILHKALSSLIGWPRKDELVIFDEVHIIMNAPALELLHRHINKDVYNHAPLPDGEAIKACLDLYYEYLEVRLGPGVSS